MKKQLIKILLLISFFAFTLAGCQRATGDGGSPIISSQSTPPPTVVSTPRPIGPTSTGLTQGLVTPSAASSPLTDSPPPRVSTPLDFMATITKTPKMSTSEAYLQVESLINESDTCRLPCWWGITPGLSTQEEVIPFLYKISDSMSLVTYEGEDYYQFDFTVPESFSSDSSFGMTIVIRDRIVDRIRFGWETPIDDFLSRAGKPDEIYIYGVSSNTMSPKARFSIALFYSKIGLIGEYQGWAEKGDIIQVCPNRIEKDYPIITIWRDEQTSSFEKISNEKRIFGTPPHTFTYLPLENATEIGVVEFYERYRLIDNVSTCFLLQDPDISRP